MSQVSRNTMSRRQFLRLSALGSGGALLAACGLRTAPTPTPTSIPPTPVPPTVTPAVTEEEEEVIVGDVLEYALASDAWPGAFGFVTFHLHEGRYNGESIYFIRTDASNADFAAENGLVHVPLLNAGRDTAASLYLFNDGRLPVFSSSPDDEASYIPLYHLKQVTVNDAALELDSAAAVEQAAADGNATIEEQSIFVNYPIVKWAGGELSVDTERDSYLGTGQLLEAVNTSDMTVTFKLHECFPGSRYIITDTSIVPMAPMMSIPASPPSLELVASRATDKIWVFGNGIPGSGVMGFQPAIFGNKAGEPIWSPFWDHFTVVWNDESQARLLRSAAEVQAAIDAGELELFNGVPDSHPEGFVVNCPVPVLAPNNSGA
jgi:hypothetical protein